MINIVIPMAGAGSRFKDAGYELPKPFIDVNGKMMIERVLDGLQVANAKYTLIIQEYFLKDYSEKINLIKEKYGANFVTVMQITQGASCTALIAHEYINNDDMVIFADSDNFFSNDVFKKFIDDAVERKLDGSLLTFNTDDARFSFIELNADGYVIRTREKEAISNHAITGIYLFSRGKDFVKYAINMMAYGDKTKNEYYMSNVYNWAIQDNKKIGFYDISNDDWVCVGTPDQLNKYLSK